MDALVFIAFLLVLSKAWSTIIQVPENGTYSVGSNILLKCVTKEENNNIIWRDFEEDTIIFIGKDKNTMKEKYRNFEISPSPRNYSLTINDASTTDEGSYSCQDGDIHWNAWLTIKVLPTSALGVDQSEVSKVPAVLTAVVLTGSVICCLTMMCFILWKKKRQITLFISPNSTITSSNHDQSVMNRPEIVDRPTGESSMPMNGTLDIYEKIYANVPMDKIVMLNEMKIISRLKKSVDMERWVGMLKSVERVVVSSPTVRGSVTSRTDWAAYVKKLLDLPSVTHIVNIRGVCIEEGQLYVIQEYVPNGTLRNHLIALQSKQNADRALTLLAFLELASSLLHGIAFIHRKKFYHPGLSSDKVLITTDNKCKLYDFCTADMVKDKINYILEKQKEETICQILPPEAVFQRSYDDASDMWSLAVTLWEIFSYGKILMLTFQQLQPGNEIHVSNIPDRHDYLPESIFQLILQCWNVCSARRPTVQELRKNTDKELSLCKGSTKKNKVCTAASGLALYQGRIYSGNSYPYEVPNSGSILTTSNNNFYSDTRYEVPTVLSNDESYEPMSVPTLFSDESDEAYVAMS